MARSENLYINSLVSYSYSVPQRGSMHRYTHNNASWYKVYSVLVHVHVHACGHCGDTFVVKEEALAK